MSDSCAAANCGYQQRGPGGQTPLFNFPADAERCKQWLTNCCRPDLASQPPEQLLLYRLCAKHFEPSLISQQSPSGPWTLKDDAVPTIFEVERPGNNQSPNRKRTREPLEEEHPSAKKVKELPAPVEHPADLAMASGENSTCMLHIDDPLPEDPPSCKAKEILKAYFKENLALTGFSIPGASLSSDEPMAGGPHTLSPVCVEKIDKKEILHLSEDLMREEILKSLKLARFFSILLHDVTSIEGKEQIPVFIRSVTIDGFPQKHLIGFLPCDADAENLFYMLLSELRSRWGLRMEHCRGLTYLVTGSMCQKIRDLTCRILQEFPQVVLSPSDPYAFNIWIIRCMPVPSIQKVADAVEEVASLLRRTPDLWRRLEGKIQMVYGHVKGEAERIKAALSQNWEYCTDAFQIMLDILEPFLNCINETISKVDEDTAEQMAKLKPVLKNFNFIITLVVLKNTLCCVSILNSSLRGIISISSTLQYTISNALKLVSKYQQELAILHRKWFSDAVGRAKKLVVEISKPELEQGPSSETPLDDFYRESLSRPILQYLVAEVKRVFSTEMVRILRWLSLVPSYMADHNFSIRRDKVADANLNNLARPDTFYEELGSWEVKWKHASKRRILPTTVFATLKIPDIGFYPNVQSLLRVLGTVPCVNAEADVYGQYHMVLERCHAYLSATAEDQRRCNIAYVYVNQDVHFSIEKMVEFYVQKHPEVLQLLQMDADVKEKHPQAAAHCNHAEKDTEEEVQLLNLELDAERLVELKCAETDREALKSALQAAVVAAASGGRSRAGGDSPPLDGDVEYVTKSEMKEVLSVCENAVREGILMEVGNSFFSLFIDCVVRFGEKDRLPLFLRFVDSFDVMRLELMGFVDADLDCDDLVQSLLDIVTVKWHLDLKNCRGQAYLGSGDVSYKLKAFACKVQEKYPLAISTHCSCYSFNTWWSKSIPVSAIKRALDLFEEVLRFFGSSAGLQKQLDQVIAFGLRESYEKVQEFQGTFCLLWQEKHDSYEAFVQMLEPLVETLEKMKKNPQRWTARVSEHAAGLLLRVTQFDFIIAMVVLKNVSSFTRELSAGLQKDHLSAASQLCQISGIVATLNRVKTTIKVFHQNWFDEASAVAHSLGVQVELPESLMSRDGLIKPLSFYKDSISVPLVDNLISAVKDHFSEDHKEALNFLSLVPCSVTVSYMFESLKSKPPLYSSDLPDADNFFTELCCWRVTWKTKVASVTIPATIFSTLRLPIMQYFGNINTLLRIMSVLPSTALEDCGVVLRYLKFQEYLRSTNSTERSPCLAMLRVSTDFSRDLEHMVTQCLKVTPQALEGICLEKESKSFVRNLENDKQVDSVKKGEEEEDEDGDAPSGKAEVELKAVEENGCMGDNSDSLNAVFSLAALLRRRNSSLAQLPDPDRAPVLQRLSLCHWVGGRDKDGPPLSDGDAVRLLIDGLRSAILKEIQESPFFSLIIDRPVRDADGVRLPVFVRYVEESAPKVELMGFLPLDEGCSVDAQARRLAAVLTDEWRLPMAQCRGQAFLRSGTASEGLKQMSRSFLELYPLSVVTPSESCGLAHWLLGSVPCPSVARMLALTEDLLEFFDESPGLQRQLAQTVDKFLNMPREALEEMPETCYSKWNKREDFFDLLVDTLEAVLSCLDACVSSAAGSKSKHAKVLSTQLRGVDFIVSLVIVKNACAPLRNCSTVFRCGNPADILCEVEKIPSVLETLNKMLRNVNDLHAAWFEQAFRLATKLAPEQVCFSEEVGNWESPELYYRERLSVPLLRSLVEEMQHSFSDSHLKALSLLSLLPSCSPILREASEQPYSLYFSELPEPETATQDLNIWASIWREKHQEAPPTSIAETLVHPESKNHPSVSLLLRLVAVLPSVSMEWDQMRSTLNSTKLLLRDAVCTGSRFDRVMLLSHRSTLLRLPEAIQSFVDVCADSRTFFSQVAAATRTLRLEAAESLEATPAAAEEACETSADPLGGLDHGEDLLNAAQGPRTMVSFYEPELREQIIKELWDSQFFTIITEEAVEIEGGRYVPLSIRYLNKEDIQCEETLAFIPLTEDPALLSEAIETALSEKWGLNMEYCRGQAVLGVGTEGAQMRAVSSAIAHKYPQAVRTLSSSLSLNVWLARSSPAREAADGAAVIQMLLQWLTEDGERQNRVEDMIHQLYAQDEGKVGRLRDGLIKNWEKSHDMHELMVDTLQVVVLCLNQLKEEGGPPGQRQQASAFLDAIRDFDFILAAVVQKHVLAATKKLSQSFQGKPLDMLLAVNKLPEVKLSLRNLRSDLDACHQAWFEEAVAAATRLRVSVAHPLLLESLSELYKESLSAKVTEHSIAQVEELFTEKVLDTLRCLEIVPYAMAKVETSALAGLVLHLYREDLPDQPSLHSELKSWKEKWLDPLAGYLPTTVLDTLKTTQIRSFGNIETLLRLQIILPFSRREANFRQGRRSLPEFVGQDRRRLSELHPL